GILIPSNSTILLLNPVTMTLSSFISNSRAILDIKYNAETSEFVITNDNQLCVYALTGSLKTIANTTFINTFGFVDNSTLLFSLRTANSDEDQLKALETTTYKNITNWPTISKNSPNGMNFISSILKTSSGKILIADRDG